LAKEQADGDRLACPLQELTDKGYPRMRVYYWHLSEVRGETEDGLYRWACPFNGTFFPARVVVEVGLPNKDFFIEGDERDFLWRVAKRYDLYTAVDSHAFHPIHRMLPFNWKQYYHIRNALVINRHFNHTALRNLKLITISLARGVWHGRRGIRLVWRAMKDGLRGQLGKRNGVFTWLDAS
jgi:GT2 family glycosyltransferase